MSAATATQRRKLEIIRADGTLQVIPARARRLQQTITNLVANGPLGVSSLTNPGLRLSHYIFVLRTEYGLPIHMEKVDQPGGVGWYGRYTLGEKVKLLLREKTKPTTGASGSASNPKSLLAGAGGSE